MKTSHLFIISALLGLVPVAALAATSPTGSWEPAVGKAATRALNLLEAKGYGDFRNFASHGDEFTATVTRQHRTETLVIHPGSGTIQAGN